jgi:putative holliday junction resolvase
MKKQDPIYYLGIDWGEKRIGLAKGDSHVKLALPLMTVSSLKEILQIIKDEKIDCIVLGWPRKMNGGKEIDFRWQNFANILKEKVYIPVILQDERLSSLAADALSGRPRDKVSRDVLAAVLILQSYLDNLN